MVESSVLLCGKPLGTEAIDNTEEGVGDPLPMVIEATFRMAHKIGTGSRPVGELKMILDFQDVGQLITTARVSDDKTMSLNQAVTRTFYAKAPTDGKPLEFDGTVKVTVEGLTENDKPITVTLLDTQCAARLHFTQQ